MTRSGPGIRAARIVGRTLVAALIAALGWLIGLQPANALSLSVFALALYALRGLTPGEVDNWRPEPDTTHNTGTRREIARLSWGMHGQDARVDRWSTRRLYALAARRLSVRGLDLGASEDSAGCRRVLGDQTYDALKPDPNNLPRYTSFVAALDVVERLSLEETPR